MAENIALRRREEARQDPHVDRTRVDDRRQNVVAEVADDARRDAARWLKDTEVPEGGE